MSPLEEMIRAMVRDEVEKILARRAAGDVSPPAADDIAELVARDAAGARRTRSKRGGQ